MCRLNHIEEHTAVSNVDGCSPQLLVKARIVQQIEVLEHQQSECLVVGIQCHLRPQLVKCVAIQLFGVMYQLYYIHR